MSIHKVLLLECFPLTADRNSDRCRGLIDQQVRVFGDDSYILRLDGIIETTGNTAVGLVGAATYCPPQILKSIQHLSRGIGWCPINRL